MSDFFNQLAQNVFEISPAVQPVISPVSVPNTNSEPETALDEIEKDTSHDNTENKYKTESAANSDDETVTHQAGKVLADISLNNLPEKKTDKKVNPVENISSRIEHFNVYETHLSKITSDPDTTDKTQSQDLQVLSEKMKRVDTLLRFPKKTFTKERPAEITIQTPVDIEEKKLVEEKNLMTKSGQINFSNDISPKIDEGLQKNIPQVRNDGLNQNNLQRFHTEIVPQSKTIHVTIGRIEVKANVASPPSKKTRRSAAGNSVLPLEEYLKRRNGSNS